MKTTNLLTLVITLTVGIILAGSILMPIVEDAQNKAGETTLNNQAIAGNLPYEIWDGEAITFYFNGGGNYSAETLNTNYTINGEPNGLGISTPNQTLLFASNAFCARIGGSDSSHLIIQSQYIETATQYAGSKFTFEVDAEKNYTLVIGTNDPITYTGSLDWLVYAIPGGAANLLQLANASDPFYTSDSTDMIVLGNIYTTGDNDTFYAYFNGELSVNETYADVSSVDIEKTAVKGYSDLYTTTVTVNIGDESFTPYYIIAPKSIEAHSTTGAEYALYGAIPVLVIISLVIAAVGAVMVKRND